MTSLVVAFLALVALVATVGEYIVRMKSCLFPWKLNSRGKRARRHEFRMPNNAHEWRVCRRNERRKYSETRPVSVKWSDAWFKKWNHDDNVEKLTWMNRHVSRPGGNRSCQRELMTHQKSWLAHNVIAPNVSQMPFRLSLAHLPWRASSLRHPSQWRFLIGNAVKPTNLSSMMSKTRYLRLII
jgi:hypothetical protein